MPEALRWLFLGIVLLDLAFVQLTGTVTSPWLWALWSCAAVTPLLARLHEHAWYRATWNAAVVASFAFLVHDAVTSGLLHMLEDGLLLSALCQVHLLNNIGQRQRPDLLFFNSFLIAFVTSFFCGDLGWSIAFAAYAGLLVLALQLHVCLPRSGDPPKGAVRTIARDGLSRSAVALALTGAVFLLWPRDFKREGWMSDSLHIGGAPIVAFADQVRLDRTSTPTLSEAPVMRLVMPDGELPPTHWRGATFVQFDGAGWQQFRIRDFGNRRATDTPWTVASATQWRRAATGDQGSKGTTRRDDASAQCAVTLFDTSGGRLFLPLLTSSFDLEFTAGALVDPKADGIVALVDFGEGPREVRYTVRAGAPQQLAELSATARALLTQTPENVPGPLRSVEQELRRTAPPDASAAQRAEHARSWLAGSRRYELPGTPGAARTLDDFLLGTGGGHCEHFATALCLLLRMQAIPSRVVGGYVAQEQDAATGAFVVRQKHAHAWVEAWFPGHGWVTLDATPEGAVATAADDDGLLADARKWMEGVWSQVTGFGEEERAAMFSWIGDSITQFALLVVSCPLESSLVIALVALLLAYRRRLRQLRRPAAVRGLEAAMRRLRLSLQDGETPRELLVRAASQAANPLAIETLERAVIAHEQERYRS